LLFNIQSLSRSIKIIKEFVSFILEQTTLNNTRNSNRGFGDDTEMFFSLTLFLIKVKDIVLRYSYKISFQCW
jgi:hypothetical protein